MFRNFKEPHVCIELEIPEQEVLLSDFAAWQRVLDDQYIDFSFSEEEYQKTREKYELLSPEDQQETKQKSWENIFFIMPHQNGWIRTGEYVQAAFWELKPEYIKSVRYIKEKK